MVLVETKEGAFWRMKRGAGGKAAELNEGFSAARDMVKMLSPVAARFVAVMRHYLRGLEPGRINNRVKSVLQRSLKETGGMDYKYFNDFVFQPLYPLYNVLLTVPEFKTGEEYVSVYVPIPEGGAVKRQNEIVTDYRFALIMFVGDPLSGQEVDTYDVMSAIYKMGKQYEEGCELRLKRPTAGEPWMCCLRIVTYEGNEVAYNSRHSGMKVVGWG